MRRRAGGLWVLGLAACAGSVAPRTAPAPTPAVANTARVKLLHSPGDADFWVQRAPDRSLVTVDGARLEVGRSGEIAAVTWDLDLTERAEPLVGALVVPERWGGGFVHWSRSRLFRSRAFTGPLEPVSFDPPGSVPVVQPAAIRGARVGASSILVFRDDGPRELLPGATSLRAASEPALLDAATLADGRAARIDVFGHAVATDDGVRFFDLSPSLGLGARNLVVGEDEIAIETLHDRFPLRTGGKLGEPVARPAHDPRKLFQIAWKEGANRVDPPWGLGQGNPLAAAIGAGGDAGDGTAFGVVQGMVVRVDLTSGQTIFVAGEWTPNGLICQPVRAPDALLFACTWERYQGYGGCLLRSDRGAPPTIERAFSDDGMFAVNDDGVIGFVGSCRGEARFFDPEEPARGPENASEAPLAPVFCVRRGPGEWVERRVEIGDDAKLHAWIPGSDGRAAALVTSSDPLPQPPSPAGRVFERGGVRIVHVERETQGFAIPRMGAQGDAGNAFVERRFHLHDDGSIDVWLTPVPESAPVVAGATLDTRGALTVHTAAPQTNASVGTGRFGVAISTDGSLYETLDHGRTHRFAGPSPAPASSFVSATCSALGCAFGPVARVGWGDGTVTPRVLAETPPEPMHPGSRPRIACTPSGAPLPLEPAEGLHFGASTGWGDKLGVIRAPTPPAPSRETTKKPSRAPTPVHTHTLVMRSPFAVRAPVRRIETLDPLATVQPSSVTPLLGPRGDVSLFVVGDRRELLVVGDRATTISSFDRSKYRAMSYAAGLVTAADRALMLGTHRRHLALEDVGPGARMAPTLLGAEIDPQRSRPVTLGRRDDGAVAVLVLDGAAPETAGAAIVDRVTATAGPVARLAPWSTLVSADDPACKPSLDPSAFRALLVADPSAWMALDQASLPSFGLAHQGLMLVRWGRDRVCLEALDAALVDRHTRRSNGDPIRLVARWSGDTDRGAAVRRIDMRQDLTCRIAR